MTLYLLLLLLAQKTHAPDLVIMLPAQPEPAAPREEVEPDRKHH